MCRILYQEIYGCDECYCLRIIPKQKEGFEFLCSIHSRTIEYSHQPPLYIPEWCPLPKEKEFEKL